MGVPKIKHRQWRIFKINLWFKKNKLVFQINSHGMLNDANDKLYTNFVVVCVIIFGFILNDEHWF